MLDIISDCVIAIALFAAFSIMFGMVVVNIFIWAKDKIKNRAKK